MSDLDEAGILADARAAAGLDDFGDEFFRAGLRVLLRALDDPAARLAPHGRDAQRMRTVALLVNRLRAEDCIRRHPEILDEQIREPLVIVGLPRTGTTLLHRTIASDQRFHAVRWYECRFPAPVPGADGGPDPRIAQAEAEVQAMLSGSPALAAIHPLEAQAPDEEILLLEHSFYSTVPESSANVPAYGRWLDTQDQTRAYQDLHRLLQLLQWQKRRAGARAERWVLKTPHHLGWADTLLATFPDARMVQTHRDPLEAIPSLASMIYALWVLAAEAVEREDVGRLWSGRMARALGACLAVRDRNPDRFVDVWFRDAARDPVGQARRIYAAAGLAMTADAERAMRAYVATNPREGRPPHQYTLEEFGLTQADVERDFADYRRRFIVERRGE